MTAQRIFRVFVSSTFSDMQAERRILHTLVFPRLRKVCSAYGAVFQDVDLRWGITEEVTREHGTMDVCLGEIARCQRLSPKPNFISLVGERYGWCPVPSRIPHSEMQVLLPLIAEPEKDLITSWYLADANAVPAEWCLKYVTSGIPGENERGTPDWQRDELLLRNILLTASLNAGFDNTKLAKYQYSATHLEIIEGALNLPDGIESSENHVFAYFKNYHKSEPAEDMDLSPFGSYFDIDEDGVRNSKSIELLAKLRSDLEFKIGMDHIWKYEAEFRKNCMEPVFDEDAFAERIEKDLLSVIMPELEAGKTDPTDTSFRTDSIHEKLSVQLTRNFTGRGEELSFIREYLSQPSMYPDVPDTPLFLEGDYGSGKSSIIAAAARRACSEYPGSVIITKFLGISPETGSSRTLLPELVRDLLHAFPDDGSKQNFHGKEKKKDTGRVIEDPAGRFKMLLARPTAERPLIIFLDALDQLSDKGLLGWIPGELPPNVKIVLSGPPLMSKRLKGVNVLKTGALDDSSAGDALRLYFKSSGRSLTQPQTDAILTAYKNTGLPVHLRILFELNSRLRSYETPLIPPTVDQALNLLFDTLESKHGSELVRASIGYILSSRRKGLRESEILALLRFDEFFWNGFVDRSHPAHREEIKVMDSLPFIVWSRFRTGLDPYLAEREGNGEPLLSFFHRLVGEYSEKRYGDSLKHQLLIQYFLKQKTDERSCSEIPFLAAATGDWGTMCEQCLGNLDFLAHKISAGYLEELMEDFLEIFVNAPRSIPARLSEWITFFRMNYPVIRRGDRSWPSLKIFIQLAAESTGDSIREQAERWINERDACWPVLRMKNPVAPLPGVRYIVEASEGNFIGNGKRCAFRLSSQRIAFLEESGTIHIYDDEYGWPLKRIQTGMIVSPDFLTEFEDGNLLVAGKKEIMIIDPESESILTVIFPPEGCEEFLSLYGVIPHRKTGTILAIAAGSMPVTDKWGQSAGTTPIDPRYILRYTLDGFPVERKEMYDGPDGFHEIMDGKIIAWRDGCWFGRVKFPGFIFETGPGKPWKDGSLTFMSDCNLIYPYYPLILRDEVFMLQNENVFVKFCSCREFLHFNPETFEISAPDESALTETMNSYARKVNILSHHAQNYGDTVAILEPYADIELLMPPYDPRKKVTSQIINVVERTSIVRITDSSAPGGSWIRIVDNDCDMLLASWPLCKAPEQIIKMSGIEESGICETPWILRSDEYRMTIIDPEIDTIISSWYSHRPFTSSWSDDGNPVINIETECETPPIQLILMTPGNLLVKENERVVLDGTYATIVRDLREKAPGTAEYWIENARLVLYQGKEDLCIKYLEKAQSIDSSMLHPFLMRRSFMLEASDEVLYQFDDLVFLAQNDLNAWHKIEFAGDNPSDEAWESLVHIETHYPCSGYDPETFKALENVGITLNYSEESGTETEESMLEKFNRLYSIIPPDRKELLKIKARLFYYAGQFHDSIEWFTRYLDNGGCDLNARLELIASLAEVDDIEKAVNMFINLEKTISQDKFKLLKYSSDIKEPLMNILPVDPGKALEILELYRKKKPLLSVSLKLLIVRCLIKLGHTPDKIIPLLDQVISSGMADIDCFKTRAELLVIESRFDEACDDIEHFLEREEKREYGSINSAIILLWNDKKFELLRSHPGFISLMITRFRGGSILMENGGVFIQWYIDSLVEGKIDHSIPGAAGISNIIRYVANNMEINAAEIINRIRPAGGFIYPECIYIDAMVNRFLKNDIARSIPLFSMSIDLTERDTADLTGDSTKYRFERACANAVLGNSDATIADLESIINWERVNNRNRFERFWELEAYVAPELEILDEDPRFLELISRAKKYCELMDIAEVRSYIRSEKSNRDRLGPDYAGYPRPDLEEIDFLFMQNPELFLLWKFSRITEPSVEIYENLETYLRRLINDGKKKDALDFIEKLTAFRPLENSSILYLHGWLMHTYAGNPEQSILLYDRSIAQDPVNFNAYYDRACVRNKTGNRQGAIEDLIIYIRQPDYLQDTSLLFDEIERDSEINDLLSDIELEKLRGKTGKHDKLKKETVKNKKSILDEI